MIPYISKQCLNLYDDSQILTVDNRLPHRLGEDSELIKSINIEDSLFLNQKRKSGSVNRI